MAVFRYEVRGGAGREVGVLTAADLKEATAVLRSRRQTVLKLSEAPSALDHLVGREELRPSGLERKFLGLMVRGVDVELALSRFGSLLESGVPMLEALRVTAAYSSKWLGRALFRMSYRVQDGEGFAAALRHELPLVGQVALGLLAAGEANGSIDKMCEFAAGLRKRQRELRGELLQAMAYPALVILVTIGVVVFLMYNVIPKIMRFLSGRSKGLPPITQALVDVSTFLQDYGLYLLIAPLVVGVGLALARRAPAQALVIDRAVLFLPVLGKVFRASANALWSRTLGVLLSSGINIISAMDFTRDALKNSHYRGELEQVKNLIAKGQPLSTGVRVTDLGKFSPLAESMVLVGERTGRLDEGLLKVAEFSQDELERRLSVLSKMIEPALFVVVGSIVGFVYIAFFMGLMAASTGGR